MFSASLPPTPSPTPHFESLVSPLPFTFKVAPRSLKSILLGPWGTELRFWLRSFWFFYVIFFVRVEVVCVCASRDLVELTANSSKADMTPSRNASRCQLLFWKPKRSLKGFSKYVSLQIYRLPKEFVYCKETYFEKPFKDLVFCLQEFAVYETN